MVLVKLAWRPERRGGRRRWSPGRGRSGCGCARTVIEPISPAVSKDPDDLVDSSRGSVLAPRPRSDDCGASPARHSSSSCHESHPQHVEARAEVDVVAGTRTSTQPSSPSSLGERPAKRLEVPDLGPFMAGSWAFRPEAVSRQDAHDLQRRRVRVLKRPSRGMGEAGYACADEARKIRLPDGRASGRRRVSPHPNPTDHPPGLRRAHRSARGRLADGWRSPRSCSSTGWPSTSGARPRLETPSSGKPRPWRVATSR